MLSALKTVPVGVDVQAFAIPGANQIAGILVDNPSGDWLLIQPGNNVYVPPYTIGWAHSFLPTTVSVNVLATTFGAARALPPAGQVSTLQGDPVTIRLYDEPIQDSNGTATTPAAGFINQFTPVLQATVFGFLIKLSGIGIANIIPATPNKRIRILTSEINIAPNAALLSGELSSPAQYIVQETTLLTFRVTGFIGGMDKLIDTQIFPLGLDCAPGVGLQLVGSASWASVPVDISITYQLI